MDLEGMGNGGKERIKLIENRVELWTCVYTVKNLQYKQALFISSMSINVSPHSVLPAAALFSTAAATLTV
jgi:hypothetical protein